MRVSRKLEIAHWNQGKGCKGSRKAKVHAFMQNEIDQQIAEQDDEYRTRHISKGTPNLKARLEHRIHWYEQTLAQYERQGKSWDNGSMANYFRSALREAQKELEALI